MKRVNQGALNGVLAVSDNVLHIIAGQNAERYAAAIEAEGGVAVSG
jgi:hypothetical protein